MRKNSLRESGIFTLRSVAAFSIALAGVLLGLFSVTASPQRLPQRNAPSGAVTPVPTWAITPSPNMADQNFNGVTCVSSSDCWAVGTYVDANSTNQTLIEHWNGFSWSIVTPGVIDTTHSNVLNAVSCTSTSNCLAVGYREIGVQPNFIRQTLIERWDGASWTVVTTPNSSTALDNSLSGIVCNSATDCWAVGFHDTSPNHFLQTLILRWNGVTWSISTSPNSSTSQNNSLNSVTCTSSTNCYAVGSHDAAGGVQQTLIEKWNGTSWAIVTSPNTSSTQTNVLNGVACASATECSAVGYYFTGSVFQTLIARWNGTSWLIVVSPNSSTTQFNFLFGVTCTATTNCWAVGNFMNNNGVSQTLVERWNGSSWSIVSSPSTSDVLTNSLQAVTCSSLSDCWAVGSYNNAFDQTLAEHWNGTAWSIFASPNIGIVPSNESNALVAITCSSPADCWAVGTFDPGNGTSQTLIEHWNGSSWVIIRSPNTDVNQTNELASITCTSASNCWAVGDYNPSMFQTLILHWDGNSWSIVPSPNTSISEHNFLNSVTCTSASNCWAVGYYIKDNIVDQTLIEQWNGSSWSIVPSPNSSNMQSNHFNGVACPATTDCWAVGFGGNGLTTQTLIARWNGSVWTAVTSPNTSTTDTNFFNSVTCTSGSNCWAVGQFDTASAAQTLIARWNGTSWSIVPSPNTSGSVDNILNDVACASSLDCSAVGVNGSSVQQTLIQRWNGSAWTILNSPNTSATDQNFLAAVTCASNSDCWTVGSYQNGGISQTLIQKRTLPVLGFTSVTRPTTGISAGHFIINGKAVANSMVNVYASPSGTTPFTFLGSTMADSNGNFLYDDAGAVSIMPPVRFYQVTYP